MQTDSVLDAQDREIMWRWGQPATREFFTENASNCSRIAGELSRLEQENRQLRVESDSIKASMFSVLTALKLGGHVRPQSWSEVVSDEIVPAIERLQTRVDSLDCAHKLALGEVERLTTENTDLKEVASKMEVILRSWRSHWEAEHEQLATTRDALTAARAEVQRLRENAEMDQAQRAEWQETIDKLEAENEKLSTNLRLSLVLSDPVHAGLVMERISTLEGRVQGILDSLRQDRPATDGKRQILRNPFEDLRPPRGL